VGNPTQPAPTLSGYSARTTLCSIGARGGGDSGERNPRDEVGRWFSLRAMTDIDALVDRWMAAELQHHPERATTLGIDGHDDRLTDHSSTAYGERLAGDREWLDEIEQVDRAGLTLDEQIDLDLLASALRGRVAAAGWEAHRRDPGPYVGGPLGSIFTLFLHRIHDDHHLATAAAARLDAIPGVLADAQANLDPEMASPVFVDRAIGQARGAAGYCRDVVAGEVGPGPDRDALSAAGERAAAALESFATFLSDLAPRARGGYAIGEDLYGELLQTREGLGYGASELRERGQRAYDEIDAEMTEVARSIGGDGDWRAVLQSLNSDHPATPEAMRDEYELWTEKARQFLKDHELVTFPEGEECRVVPSPAFQRPVLAVAFYMTPPAFRPSSTGHFFVPYPPDGTSEEEVQKRLETNSHSSIPTVAVHEAYPGHHWHLTWAQQNPRPLRRVLSTPYFSEGWALYAERLMRENGFFTDPRHDLAHLDARIFRAARIVVDTSLHAGDMTFEQAVEHMTTKASLSEPTARAEVARYCAWPTQASSYLTGCLEIERIRDDYLAAGRGSVRQFNDTLAGSGMLPLALARRAVMEG
jgi:uncharacterized protein (DUF885 family)